jgi:hypothetical protein
VTALWNQGGQTDREVAANKPDIIIKNKRENMDTDRCGNTSGQKYHAKGSRKETKYKRLCIEIQRMWNMIRVVSGATGMVTKGLRKNLEAMQGKHSIDSLQKAAVL